MCVDMVIQQLKYLLSLFDMYREIRFENALIFVKNKKKLLLKWI